MRPLFWGFVIISLTWGLAGREGDAASTQTTRRGLIFGGNGNIGSQTVTRLIAKDDKITIVNRGNWYWDTLRTVKPHVEYYQCDRQKSLEEDCPDLYDFISRNTFDYVIDFSGFNKHAIEQSTEALRGRTKLYVYISRDFVYDACTKEEGQFSKEEDVLKLKDHVHEHEGQRELKAHRVLAAEEAIKAQRENGGFPYVILRPSDVIGPRDTSYRWCVYQMGAKVATRLKKVNIPQLMATYNISLVYSKDLAEVIVRVLDLGDKVKDEAFNLAWPEPVTLKQMVETMVEEMGYDDLQDRIDVSKANPPYWYPSVVSGPLNVSKAERVLGWRPTPFRDAVRETVDFYDDVMTGSAFNTQKDEIVQAVGAQAFRGDSMAFYKALEDVYNIDLSRFTHVHQEL